MTVDTPPRVSLAEVFQTSWKALEGTGFPAGIDREARWCGADCLVPVSESDVTVHGAPAGARWLSLSL